MKLFTKTFGCQMNFADSDEMGRHLKTKGFVSTPEEEAADAVLINTCTVRDLAEHKAMSYIGRLREWKAGHPERIIIVTGCAAERTKADLKQRFPYVDLIVGAKDIESFPGELEGLLKRHPRKPLAGIQELINPGFPTETFGNDDPVPAVAGSPVIQYVTTMRGCNYNCTYCIVPSVRGREIYRPIETILAETADRVKEGAKEIWLLGQTVNSYKPENPPVEGYDFANLLQDVAKVPGVERLRFMSPHPHYLTDKLVRAIAETPNVCEHMHLPVQSGSTRMLGLMKRNYTRDTYLRGVEKLRQAVPGIAITTDIIVGFPGETEDDFQQTLDLVDTARFDSAYCFKYSPRPGTVAADSMADDVPEEEKERRINLLLERTEAHGREKAKSFIGTTQEVLLEDDKGEGVVRGKTRGAWRVRIKDSSLRPGMTVQAKITGTHSRELHAELSI